MQPHSARVAAAVHSSWDLKHEKESRCGSHCPDSLKVFLFEVSGHMNIGCFQASWTQIDELVRYVCGAEDDLPFCRLNLFIANNKESISLAYDENFVIRMSVQSGAMSDNIGRKEYDRRIGAKSLAFDTTGPGIVAPRPLLSFQNNGLFGQNAPPGF